MKDSLLHSLLGLTILLAIVAAFFLLGPWLAGGLYASWDIYFREVTQQQGKHFGNDFRKGWLSWKWSREKNIETWIPVGVVLGVAAAIHLGVT